MREIAKTVKLVAQYFPKSPETVSDVFQCEIKLRAEEHFREGCSVAAAFEEILEELPETISAEDKAGVLKIVAKAWRQFKVEGGDRLVRNGSGGTSTK